MSEPVEAVPFTGERIKMELLVWPEGHANLRLFEGPSYSYSFSGPQETVLANLQQHVDEYRQRKTPPPPQNRAP